MDFAANFTAIDFETASRRPDSACQLAAVTVREGRIADQAMWMIRPEPFYFSRSNIQIHGITPQKVREEPVFGDLWSEIAETLTCDCLVAHNASFDIGVLLACLRAHQQMIPDLQFTCTRAIARRTWPHHRRYGLKPLSNWLGIRFRHHDALEDSIACAKILLAAGIDREAESLEDLEKRLKLSRGRAGDWGHRGPTGRSARKRKPSVNAQGGTAGSPVDGTQTAPLPFLFPGQVASPQSQYRVEGNPYDSVDLQRLMIRAEFIRPLSGMRVVFSGRLRSVNPEEAESLARRLGGTCQDRVDESTDFLVVGSQAGAGSAGSNDARDMGAEAKAREFQAEGKPIRIVNEEEFIGLVISPAADS